MVSRTYNAIPVSGADGELALTRTYRIRCLSRAFLDQVVKLSAQNLMLSWYGRFGNVFRSSRWN